MYAASLDTDVHVFPPDLSWTMAFTHEQGGLGPYYSRSEWQTSDPETAVTRSATES